MDRNRYRREDVAVIYQAYNLFPLLTALENVMYPLELRGIKAKEARVQAAEMIRSVGLGEEMFRRYPAMLSGGEQQRTLENLPQGLLCFFNRAPACRNNKRLNMPEMN
jgi:putative ABC transport system ATP-binding protein